LRKRRLVREFQSSLRECCERGDFRVVHYSVQRDHVHFLVEASSSEILGRGMKSVAARLARAVNRVFERTGGVMDGRYHLRLLRSPKEVRRALAYVLLNARRHWFKRVGFPPPVVIDEASSGRWFDGWRAAPSTPPPCGPPEIAQARTWLVRLGWRRHGFIDPCEVPGQRSPLVSRFKSSRRLLNAPDPGAG
jgi:REP element-mobilizing transposase RayT